MSNNLVINLLLKIDKEMNKNNLIGQACNGCRFHSTISNMCITICTAPQNNKNHADYDKFKDLLFTEDCPLKELEEDNEFLYWK